jgi:hypothetical protein
MLPFSGASLVPLVLETYRIAGLGCCALVCVGGAAVMIILIVRQSMGNRFTAGRLQTRQPPRFQRPRVVTDGFWLNDSRIVPGSLIRYRYWSGGRAQTGTHRVEPGPTGQFIYTGDQPDEVEILDVMPAEVPTLEPVDDWDSPDASGAPSSAARPEPPTDDDFPPEAAPTADAPDRSESDGDFPAAY